jgi:hypothetical protein
MLATITAAFFRLFVWHQALGKASHELAHSSDFTAEELEELKWRFPKKYDRCSARAMQLVRHERAARCSANVEERFQTADAKDLPHLARALEILARLQLMKAPTKKAARRPEEDATEKVTREDYELAVFHIELQKQLQHKPELYQAVIDQVLKHDAPHAHEAKPEPTKPAPVKKSFFNGLLLFVASWFGLVQHNPLPPFQ